MKKMTLATAALTAMIAASTTTSVFADTEVDATHRNSEGTVNVTAPDDPDNTGNLILEAVPDIDFSDVAVGTSDSPATTISSDLKTKDVRATGEGWDVTVQYGDGNGAVLTDATQAWLNGTVNGKGFIMNLAKPVYAADAGEGLAPSTTSAVEVNTDAQKISVAAADTTGVNAEGLGEWSGSFATADTKITIPSNNIKGNYKAQLLWTIESTPEA